MTRKEVEKIILEKLQEIREVVSEYYEEENVGYLSMSIYDDCIMCNNDYWDDHKPIDFWTVENL